MKSHINQKQKFLILYIWNSPLQIHFKIPIQNRQYLSRSGLGRKVPNIIDVMNSFKLCMIFTFQTCKILLTQTTHTTLSTIVNYINFHGKGLPNVHAFPWIKIKISLGFLQIFLDPIAKYYLKPNNVSLISQKIQATQNRKVPAGTLIRYKHDKGYTQQTSIHLILWNVIITFSGRMKHPISVFSKCPYRKNVPICRIADRTVLVEGSHDFLYEEMLKLLNLFRHGSQQSCSNGNQHAYSFSNQTCNLYN